MRRTAPEPLEINWKRKPVESARSGLEVLPDGRIRCWIEHDVIRNVTPEMLVWWFGHLEGDVEIGGAKYNRYRVWHPRDHVSLEYVKRNPDGSVGVGSVIHLVEMLDAQPKYLVDVYTEITKLDETGYRHTPRVHGLKVAVMTYEFERVPEGTLYHNNIMVGARGLLGKLINPFIRRFVFDEANGRAWIKHNIEEVGNFEFFLPDLYQKEAGSKDTIMESAGKAA